MADSEYSACETLSPEALEKIAKAQAKRTRKAERIAAGIPPAPQQPRKIKMGRDIPTTIDAPWIEMDLSTSQWVHGLLLTRSEILSDIGYRFEQLRELICEINRLSDLLKDCSQHLTAFGEPGTNSANPKNVSRESISYCMLCGRKERPFKIKKHKRDTALDVYVHVKGGGELVVRACCPECAKEARTNFRRMKECRNLELLRLRQAKTAIEIVKRFHADCRKASKLRNPESRPDSNSQA